jgi:nitroreductase
MQSHMQPNVAPDIDQVSNSEILLPEDLLRWVVSVAVRAPSIHNSQPWRFVARDPAVFELFADRTRQLSVADPASRQLHISAGAALHHATLALHGIGRRARITLLPDPATPDLLARIVTDHSGSLPDPEEWALLHATRERHTHRSPFADGRLSKQLLVDLAAATEREGGQIRFVERAGERRTLADLVAAATRQLEADPDYRREIMTWTTRDREALDGVPETALAAPATGDEFRQRSFGPSAHLWLPEESSEHPDILLLWSPSDSPADWMRTGAALSALLLTATCAGAAASMLNQPLEIPALREQMRRELRLPGYPQMLMRLGYSAGSTPTPRRAVADVLTTPPSRDAGG